MMDYKDMSIEDVKLHLLSGDSVKVDNLIIPQYTIRDLKDYGYSNYMSNLQWLSLTVDDFINAVMDLENRVLLQAEKSKLKAFDFYTKIHGSKEMLEGLILALAMVLKTTDIRYLNDEGVIVIDLVKDGIYIHKDGELIPNDKALNGEENLKVIHRDNFDEIIEIVKTINYLKSPKEKRVDNPVDEATKKLMEQMEENRRKVEEIKNREKQANGEDDNVDIADIISAVTVKSNSINKFNVWDLSVYQLYDEYARLEVIDNYDFSIRAMMAGAEKVEVTHWSARL